MRAEQEILRYGPAALLRRRAGERAKVQKAVNSDTNEFTAFRIGARCGLPLGILAEICLARPPEGP